MDEKEKQIIEDYKSNLELYKYENKIGLRRINIDEKIYGMEVIINVIDRLQKENEELKNIRYDTPYGTETIHLIPESNLIEINTQKYMIEVESGKFVDLKQVYLENKKLNEYKENYIPIQKIKDKIKGLDNVSYAEELEDIMNRENYTITELVQYVLQELIEESEK